MRRVYLDWNATAPLRPEARAAMLDAMDRIGNPSSVHAEGRAARAVIETARGQIASLVGCEPQEVVFTSGATEAAALGLVGADVVCADVEHDCVVVHCRAVLDATGGRVEDSVDAAGAQQGANSETGVLQDVLPGRYLSDQVQNAGKVPVSFAALNARSILVSAHKMGGPKGVGALVLKEGQDLPSPMPGGGQEMGRRSGTENVIGIAGFGAAAAAAQRDLENGVWDRVAKLRMILEEVLEVANPDTICVGKDAARLPNTSCVITPGWKGETQVMAMDLAGYAISAGSACSSGKVKESRVLRAMGFDAVEASSAIRVSLGPTTTEDEVLGFAKAWSQQFKRWRNRAA